MTTKFYIILNASAILAFTFLTAERLPVSTNYDDDHKYIGMEKCASVCHTGDLKGRQYEIWKASKHSQAYKDLKTDAADSIASSKGYNTAAAETPECVRCHVLGKDIIQSELEPTFDKTQGVQCESCHGAGSDYRMLLIMKDKQKAISNGLMVHDLVDYFCKNCHNEESPTFKSFNFYKAWEEIEHSDPNIPRK